MGPKKVNYGMGNELLGWKLVGMREVGRSGLAVDNSANLE
jgi:hypothetical protein